MDKLVERDGKLFVMCESYDSFKPEVTRNFYPVSDGYGGQVRASDFNAEYVGKEVRYNQAGGYYSLDRGMLGELIVRLPQGGRTLSAFTETEAVPPPKVRRGVETRWHYGRWQKYLRTQGWVAA